MPDLNHLHEHELLERVALGDENAFRTLFNAYHHQLGAYIFRVTDSAELAEEVVQDVFLKIWMNRETLASVKSFKAYLYVVSKNHALNCLRKIIKERNQQVAWDENTINAIPVTDDEQQNKYYSLLDQAVNQLPAQQQKVYLLSRHEHLKYVEIAEKLDISRETVKKYIQIAVASITAYVQANSDLTMLLALLYFFY